MQSKEFFAALNQIAEVRGLDKDKLLEVMERGLLNAVKKELDYNENITIEFNEEKEQIKVFENLLIVKDDPDKGEIALSDAKKERKTAKVGEILNREVKIKEFGRIAAVSVKQILTQGLKQLEREKIYEIFKDKENEMINTKISALNKEYVTLDLGHDLETSLPRKELLRTDEARINAKLKVYVTKVEMTPKGPKVYVSRNDKNLVKRLIEQTVPEIQDGTVEIMGLARDAGERSKVSVYSHDENVDPVGSVVGYRGQRINEVLEALQGERVDIYEWSKDPVELIRNALEPARIIAINPDVKTKMAIVIVDDRNFTSAIGSKGQNVRLAAQSSGWKIDIKSVSDAEEMGINYRPIDEEEPEDEETA